MAEHRCYPNTLPEQELTDKEKKKIWKEFDGALLVVKKTLKDGRDVSGGSIYVGLGGIALMYFWIADQLRRGGEASKSSVLRSKVQPKYWIRALEMATEAERVLPRKRVSFLEGYSGILALLAVIHHYMGNQTASQAAVKELEAYYDSSVVELPPQECELLYGRAGYLYSLLFVEKHLGAGAVDKKVVQAVIAHLLAVGRRNAQASPDLQPFGLMYSWHGKMYLGAAHGLTGIVHTLLLASEHLQEMEAQHQGQRLVHTAVHALIAAAAPTGNLPPDVNAIGAPDGDKLVQWCHGAAGFIPMLCLADRVFGSEDGVYMRTAQRAADVIWKHGLLKKGVGLCHGISGNGYALLSLHRRTRDRVQLARAQQFAAYAALNWRQLLDVPDRPASLYEGLAGADCFMMDVMDPSGSRLPGYEL